MVRLMVIITESHKVDIGVSICDHSMANVLSRRRLQVQLKITYFDTKTRCDLHGCFLVTYMVHGLFVRRFADFCLYGFSAQSAL